MRKVWIYSALLILGVAGSQGMPSLGSYFAAADAVVTFLTMLGLGFIMIHVGLEFDIDKRDLGQYGWDYLIAMSAASLPWIFVTLYLVLVLLPDYAGTWPAWQETLLAGRFAAPTSAGVLFSMLAAAGLSATWVFGKARILAIFDDLDTILLMIPLKIMMVGLAWQLGGVVLAMALMLLAAWWWLHRVPLPTSWPWVLLYALVITIVSAIIYHASRAFDQTVPIHLEVLLPAFALGCIIRRPPGHSGAPHESGSPSPQGALRERQVAAIVSGCFMVLVGLSMPSLLMHQEPKPGLVVGITASQPMPSAGMIVLHVIMVTLLSNLGKLLPAVSYRKHAPWQHRLAVAVAMFPRGEVGAGVLVVSLSYGIGGPVLIIALLSLILNLVLTGLFILIVKRLIVSAPTFSKVSHA